MSKIRTGSLSAKIPCLVVFLLGLFFCIYNFFWMQETLKVYPRYFDQANYIYKGIKYTHILKDEGAVRFLHTVFTWDTPRAPLYSLAMMPFLRAGGDSPLTAYLATLSFLLLFLLAVYWLGKDLGGSWVGLLAVVILAGSASFINQSRDHLSEFPLAALLAFTLLCLIKSNRLSSPGWSALAGTGMGLCLLMKTMAVAFLPGLVLYPLYRLWRDPDKKNKAFSFLIIIGLCLLVAGPFYIMNFKEIFQYLFYYGVGPGANTWAPVPSGTFWSGHNLFHYPLSLIQDFFSLPLFLLLVFLLIYRLRFAERPWKWGDDPQTREGFKILGVAVILGYLILTLSTCKYGPRFALPLLGPMAVVTAQFLWDIRTRVIKIVTLVLVAIIVTVNYSSLMAPPFTNKKPVKFLSFQIFPLPASNDEIACKKFYNDPEHKKDNQGRPLLRYEDWGFPALLKTLEEERTQKGLEEIPVLVFASHQVLNVIGLRYYGATVGAKKIFFREGGREGRDKFQDAESKKLRYLLIKEGLKQEERAKIIDCLSWSLRSREREFLPRARWELPDGSRMVLYEKAPLRRLPVLPKKEAAREVALDRDLALVGVDFGGEEALQVFYYWRGNSPKFKDIKRDLILTSASGKVWELPQQVPPFSSIGGEGPYWEEYQLVPWEDKAKEEKLSLTLVMEYKGQREKILLGQVKIPWRLKKGRTN